MNRRTIDTNLGFSLELCFDDKREHLILLASGPEEKKILATMVVEEDGVYYSGYERWVKSLLKVV